MLDSNKDVLKLEAMKILIGVKIHFKGFILNNEHCLTDDCQRK